MGIRGRRSAAALSVVSGSGQIVAINRPDPPAELTDEQAEEWRAIVSRLPGDWFPRETHGLLTQYCRHVIAARRVAQLIEAEEASEALDLTKYDRLLAMQEREGRAMSSLATRMRISQHSSYDAKKTRGQSITEKPWD